MSERRLKVFGWQGWRNAAPAAMPNGSHATREIAAVPSKAALYRLIPDSRASDFFCLTETGNAAEIALAMSEPGSIFWRGLDDYRGPWQKAPASVSPASEEGTDR